MYITSPSLIYFISGNLHFLIPFTYFAQPPLFPSLATTSLLSVSLSCYTPFSSYLLGFGEEVGCNFHVCFSLGLGVFFSGFLCFFWHLSYKILSQFPGSMVWYLTPTGGNFHCLLLPIFPFPFSCPLLIIPLHVYYTFLSCPMVLRCTVFLFPVFFHCFLVLEFVVFFFKSVNIRHTFLSHIQTSNNPIKGIRLQCF